MLSAGSPVSPWATMFADPADHIGFQSCSRAQRMYVLQVPHLGRSDRQLILQYEIPASSGKQDLIQRFGQYTSSNLVLFRALTPPNLANKYLSRALQGFLCRLPNMAVSEHLGTIFVNCGVMSVFSHLQLVRCTTPPRYTHDRYTRHCARYNCCVNRR